MADKNTSDTVGADPQVAEVTTDDSQDVVGVEPQENGNEDIGSQIDDLTPEQLEAVISGEPLPDEEEEPEEQPEEKPEDKETTGKETEDGGDEGAGEEPQPEANKTTEEKPEPDKEDAPKRISLGKLEKDQAAKLAHIVNGVRDKVYPDVETAIAAVFPGIKGPALDAVKDAAEADSNKTDDAPPEIPKEVKDVDAEIADLRAQRKKAMGEYDTDAEAELQDKIEDALLKKQRIETQVADAQRAQATYTDTFNDTVQATLVEYPQLNDDGDDLTKRVQELRDIAEFRKDPILDDPTFLGKMVEQASKELGVSAKGSKPVVKQPVQVKPQPNKTARPVGSVASGNEGFGDLSKNDALSAIDQLNPDQLEEVVESSF